jgi:hypothetical protein
MTDPYLLLTPLLALAVLALARFVGCDEVFDLEPVEPVPPHLSFIKEFVPGRERQDFTGWVGMEILIGDQDLTVTDLGRIMLTATTASHDVKIVERTGAGMDFTGINVKTVTIPASAAVVPTPDNPGFAYASFLEEVVLTRNTRYYILSHEVTLGDVFYDLDTTVIPKDAAALLAEVTASVYDIDDNPDTGYDQRSGPGTTYGPVDFKYKEQT